MGRHSAIHVTGAGGQVGRELAALVPDARLHPRVELDVTDEAATRAVLSGAGVVVHLAALTNVDECERDPDRAFSVNSRGTANVVAAAEDEGARVVYVSTDYVFDGTKDGEYSEGDPPSPVNAYGKSKMEGENHVQQAGGLVVRTSWVYGSGRNFVATMLSAARAGSELSVVDDQVGRPTWARALALGLVELIRLETTGIVHVAGDGRPCSWADLAIEAIDAAGLSAPVRRVTTEAYARAAPGPLAPRPANSALSIETARDLGVPLREWKDSVRAYVREAG